MAPLIAAAPWIMAAVGAISGHQQAKEKRAQERAAMIANAEQMRWSPWTGMKPQMMSPTASSPTTAALGGALKGGVTGMAASQNWAATDKYNQALDNYNSKTGGSPLPQAPAAEIETSPISGAALAPSQAPEQMSQPPPSPWEDPSLKQFGTFPRKPSLYSSYYGMR